MDMIGTGPEAEFRDGCLSLRASTLDKLRASQSPGFSGQVPNGLGRQPLSTFRYVCVCTTAVLLFWEDGCILPLCNLCVCGGYETWTHKRERPDAGCRIRNQLSDRVFLFGRRQSALFGRRGGRALAKYINARTTDRA